jgi:hypothetical protein
MRLSILRRPIAAVITENTAAIDAKIFFVFGRVFRQSSRSIAMSLKQSISSLFSLVVFGIMISDKYSW